jgi:hypothetical protein
MGSDTVREYDAATDASVTTILCDLNRFDTVQ